MKVNMEASPAVSSVLCCWSLSANSLGTIVSITPDLKLHAPPWLQRLQCNDCIGLWSVLCSSLRTTCSFRALAEGNLTPWLWYEIYAASDVSLNVITVKHDVDARGGLAAKNSLGSLSDGFIRTAVD